VVVKAEVEQEFGVSFDAHFAPELARLRELERDGLVRLDGDRIEAAPLGRIFTRNIAMAFDEYLGRAEAQKRRASSQTL
jgi:oxygen-independent coproporphyrinogen-3 oxidase